MKALSLVLAALMAQPVFAAGPVAPLAALDSPSGWTGLHAGIQAGQMSNALAFRGRTFQSGSTDTWGLHAGYTHDFGPHVLGAEADFNRFRGGNGDLLRIKGKAGVDLGR